MFWSGLGQGAAAPLEKVYVNIVLQVQHFKVDDYWEAPECGCTKWFSRGKYHSQLHSTPKFQMFKCRRKFPIKFRRHFFATALQTQPGCSRENPCSMAAIKLKTENSQLCSASGNLLSQAMPLLSTLSTDTDGAMSQKRFL